MEKQKKGLIRKSWCFCIVILATIFLISTPSLASLAERSTSQSIAPSMPNINSMVEKEIIQNTDVKSDGPGVPTFDDPWEVTLNFKESYNDKQDTALFGESTSASDGKDLYDVPKPGMPPEPYIYAYFDAGLASPYNKLWEDHKHYNTANVDEIWTLNVTCKTTGPSFYDTIVTISWDKDLINATEYTSIELWWKGGSKIVNMKAVSTTSFEAFSTIIYTFEIKCHVNQAPVVGDIPGEVIGEGGSFATINLNDYVSDVETADADIDWSYSGNVHLTVSIVDQVATIGVVDSDWNGAETITFTASDEGLLTDSDDVTFTVTAVNDPPVVGDILDQMVNQDESFLTFDLDNYVSDIDNLDSEITWSYTDDGDCDLIIIIDIDTHIATITIPTDWSGMETITFTATDPSLASDSDDATFTVIQYHSISVTEHWNLISIPVYDTISKTDIIVRYDGDDYSWDEAKGIYVLDTIYDWQRGLIQNYVSTDTLEPGNGYWMWAYFDCELLIASNAVGTGHITDLETKWNIMGLPYEDSLAQILLQIEYPLGTTLDWEDAVSGDIILGFIYGWDSATQMYSLETTLEPGQGYWMYAYYDCILKK